MSRAMEIAKFNEMDGNWVHIKGLWTRCVFLGPKNSPDAPVGLAIRAERDVGDFVAGKRSFATPTVTTVMTGTVMHDGRWMAPGDIYVSPAHEMSGDLLFGPEGAVIFIMFNKRSGIIPKFEDATDQKNFDAMLRAEVEEVAAGRCEKSVSILPPRTTCTTGRAIKYNTIEEVSAYRKHFGSEW